MDFGTFTQDVSTFENLTQQNITTEDVNGTDAVMAKAVGVFRRLQGPEYDWPSKIVREPGEVPSSGCLLVGCTELGLKASEQRKRVTRWCEALPSLTGLRHLWFRSNVTQELFDAACQVPGLETLLIKSSTVKTLEALEHTTAFRDLDLGYGPRVQSIEPLSTLRSLKYLGIDCCTRTGRLDPLADLKELPWLRVNSGMCRMHQVESLAPIGEMRNLRVLCIKGIASADRTLSPLFSLRRLEVLLGLRGWKAEEIAELKRLNPGLNVI